MVNLLAVVGTALATVSVLHVESATCGSETFVRDVTTRDDVETLREAMDCTGGIFVVTWSSVSIDKRIEVSHGNNLTVTGTNDAEIDAEGTDGIFLVSNGLLTLSQLVLRGGNAAGTGGAISAVENSTVIVDDCNFVDNTASFSGDLCNFLKLDR